MNIKEQIEDVIKNLTDGTCLETILLKAQVIAFKLKNESFSDWVDKEQNGWNNTKNIPSYRFIPCLVKAKIAIPFGGERIINIPVSNFDDKIYEHISKMRINESIIKIENMVKTIKDIDSGEIKMEIPTFLYSEIDKMLKYGKIQMAWQYTDISTLGTIVSNVKSSILNFFLTLNEKISLDINFNLNNLTNNNQIEQIMNQTINAGIVNMSDGTIDIKDSSIIGGHGNTVTINSDQKIALTDILDKIEQLSQEVECDRSDIAEAIVDIRYELDNKDFKQSFVKTLFKSIKGGFSEIINTEIGQEIKNLIEGGIKLIS